MKTSDTKVAKRSNFVEVKVIPTKFLKPPCWTDLPKGKRSYYLRGFSVWGGLMNYELPDFEEKLDKIKNEIHTKENRSPVAIAYSTYEFNYSSQLKKLKLKYINSTEEQLDKDIEEFCQSDNADEETEEEVEKEILADLEGEINFDNLIEQKENVEKVAPLVSKMSSQ